MGSLSNFPWLLLDFTNTMLTFDLVFFVFRKKKIKKLTIFLSIIISLFFCALDFYGGGIITTFLSLLFTLILLRPYKINIIEKSLVFFVSIFTAAITQNSVIYILLKIFNFSSHSFGWQAFELVLLITLTCYLLSFLIFYLVNKLLLKFNLLYIIEDKAVETIILISFAILTVTYISLNLIAKRLQTQLIYLDVILFTSAITLIFIAIGMSMFISGHMSKVKADYELKYLKKSNIYINELESKNNELRKFKHDYKNMVLSASASIKDDHTTDAMNKLLDFAGTKLDKSLATDIENGNLYKINDDFVRGIIVTKLMTAKSKGIATNFEISEDTKINQKESMSLTRVLGILLDNAIEASIVSEDSKLNFALISYDSYFEFVIENSFDKNTKPDLSKIYHTGYSTKKHHHGLGLSTVREIINSNKNFLLQTKINKGLFSIVLTVLDD